MLLLRPSPTKPWPQPPARMTHLADFILGLTAITSCLARTLTNRNCIGADRFQTICELHFALRVNGEYGASHLRLQGIRVSVMTYQAGVTIQAQTLSNIVLCDGPIAGAGGGSVVQLGFNRLVEIGFELPNQACNRRGCCFAIVSPPINYSRSCWQTDIQTRW